MSRNRFRIKRIHILRLKTKLANIYVKTRYGIIRAYNSNSAWASVFSVLLLFSSLMFFNYLDNKPKDNGPGVLSVTANSEIENTNPTPPAPNSAQNLDVLKWQKNIDFTDPDTESKTVIVEEIPDNQEYQSGSLDLPPGWSASYATVDNPSESDYLSTEPVPASAVKSIKLTYSTITTHKPVTQTAITKPLDQEQITAPVGMTNPSALTAQEYDNKLFIIYKSVDVADGLNDSQDMTINCYDLKTFQICDGSELGVTFPAYMSSTSGSKFGSSTKDISTPKVARLAFDDGTYGHEGYLYIPAQQGNNYGVNCLDLRLMENCGFIIIGSSSAPSQPVGGNPTLIDGFAQDGNRLYGHANPNNGGTYSNRHLEIFCIDMATVNKCSDYSSTLVTSIPALDMTEHSNHFFTTGQNLIVGNNYYFMMNYDEANPRANTLGVSTQTYFGNRVICFDLVTKLPCAGWAAGNVEYKSPEFGCGSICYYNDMVYGRRLTEKIWGAAGDYDYPRSLFVWKGSDNSDKALCVVTGSHDVTIDPGLNCLDFSNGQNYTDGVNTRPPGMLPTQWLSVPWEPGPAIATTNESGNSRFYHSYNLPTGNFLLPANTKSSVLCYDWTTQAPCSEFRFPHYWYEVQESDALDAAYIEDDKCMIGVSGYDFAWSFDANTGESPCRHVKKTVNIRPQTDIGNAYCDGQSRTSGWGKLKLDKSSLYDYRSFKVTVKDKSGNVVGSFNNVDLKTEPDGHLDISSIALSGNTDELIVDIDAELANTAPWGDDPDTVAFDANVPYLTVEMSGDPAQYCYQTSIVNECDISSASTTTKVTSELEYDTLEDTNISSIPVIQPEETQCFKDLKINVSADKSIVKPGDLVAYTLTVDNKANDDPSSRGAITGADIEATIPSGTTLYDSGGGTIVGGKIRWANESFSPKESKPKTLTLKVNGGSTANTKSYKLFASALGGARLAQASQSIDFTAEVIYGGDVYQSDNSIVLSSVSVDTTPVDTGGGDTGGGTDTGGGDTGGGTDTGGGDTGGGTDTNTSTDNNTEEQPTDTTDNNQPAQPVTGTSNSNNGPNYDDTQQPTTIVGKIATGITNVSKVVVQPIPIQVARPLPYLFIGLLVILALVFAYEAYREINLRNKVKKIYNKYNQTENLRSDYMKLISHYLNTPITLMKTTVELMQKEHTAPDTTLDKIKNALNNLTLHVSGLIDESKLILDSENQSQSTFGANTTNKTFKFWVVVPIASVFAVALFANAMFVAGNKYDPSTSNFLIQLVFYGLSSVALVFAYTNYKNQKFATIAANNELNYEETLIKSQETFIHNASTTLEKDALELKHSSSAIIDKPKGDVFGKGLESIEDMSHRLAYISDITKFAGTKLLDPATVNSITDQLAESYGEIMKIKKLTFTKSIDKNVHIRVDEQGYRQLISSTLNNSIKFTNEGGKIDLSISNVLGDKVKIVVSDDGVGISKDKLDNLLVPFGRGTEVLNYDYEGIGLDLYTDKLIAEHNGGNIDIESKEGKGTKVIITLPSKL
jgi:signal transduction histidine kinase